MISRLRKLLTSFPILESTTPTFPQEDALFSVEVAGFTNSNESDNKTTPPDHETAGINRRAAAKKKVDTAIEDSTEGVESALIPNEVQVPVDETSTEAPKRKREHSRDKPTADVTKKTRCV